ncbi:hypothetical protein LAUMK41_05784 [Mycobacterium attenuatum]|nr:hypothetical protein LAUMK41_05784 [Mycobacterium attenuatum]
MGVVVGRARPLRGGARAGRGLATGQRGPSSPAARASVRHLGHRGPAVDVVGQRDHSAAAGRGPGGVPRWDTRHPPGRIRVGMGRVPRVCQQRRHARHRRRKPRPQRGFGPARRPVTHRRLVHRQASGDIDAGRRFGLGAGAGRRCGAGRGGQGLQGAASEAAGRPDLRAAALSQRRGRPARAGPADRFQLPGAGGLIHPGRRKRLAHL